MCDGALGGHPELWVASLPADRGPEANLEMWEEAEEYLDFLCNRTEHQDAGGGEAAHCALVDAWNRCVEERRRAGDLLKLHQRWSERRVGGVHESEPMIAPKPKG